MRCFRTLLVCALLATWFVPTVSPLWAAAGILVLHVKDVQRRPVSGLQVGVEGDGGSARTGDDGKARIRLAAETKEKSWVSLQILTSPHNRDFVLVSPWDYRVLVPSFENESENFVEVVVVQRGDRAALESGSVLAALTAKINNETAPKATKNSAPQPDPKAALAVVSKQYGLPSDDLDRSIRAWGVQTSDPYEAGLAALYQRNFPQASAQLAESLRQREEKLAADEKAVADAACFLGQSLRQEGKYRESAKAYQRCLDLRPDDSSVLNRLGISVTEAGDYSAAEPILRSALERREKEFGPDDADVAVSLGNLAFLLQAKGDYSHAEPLLRRAVKINSKTDDLSLVYSLNSLGALFFSQGRYAEALPLLQQSLDLREKILGPNDPLVATSLNNVGGVYFRQGDYANAEKLIRRALGINEKALGIDHPAVATNWNNLARVLQARGDLAGAETMHRQALAIREKTLGPDHPDVAESLNHLGEVLQAEGKPKEAEPFYLKALAIDEKVLGPDHPDTKQVRRNLDSLSHSATKDKHKG